MANKGTRKKLLVDGVDYISSTKTHFNQTLRRGGRVVLTLYLAGNRKSFFRVHFIENEDPNLIAGEFAGCVSDIKSRFGENLNRPGAISAIIKKAIADGWKPELDGKPTEIRQGLRSVKQIDFPPDAGNT